MFRFKPFLYYSFVLSLGSVMACQAQTNQDLKKRAQSLAKKYIILDGHIDVPYRIKLSNENVAQRTRKGDFDYYRAKKGGLDAPFMSIFVPAYFQNKNGRAKKFADGLIKAVEKLAQQNPQKFAVATSPKEIEANFRKGIISLPLGMENGAPIEGSLRNLRYFYKRGVRYITLTHGKDNDICDSSTDPRRTWKGLSPFGKMVVKEMNQLGMMIDVSHISDETFYQIMKLSKAPVIASHSSCRRFTPGFSRNMTDAMIKALAKKGGVIQINFGAMFLNKRAADSYTKISQIRANLSIPATQRRAAVQAQTRKVPMTAHIKEVVKHIDHVVRIAGIDHVGLGSDFDGVGPTLPEGLKDVSYYPNLIYHLLKKGYSEKDIAKICYGNVFRVWRKVEKVAGK